MKLQNVFHSVCTSEEISGGFVKSSPCTVFAGIFGSIVINQYIDCILAIIMLLDLKLHLVQIKNAESRYNFLNRLEILLFKSATKKSPTFFSIYVDT